MRTILGTSGELSQLDEVISTNLSSLERKLPALPKLRKFGRLGIPVFDQEHEYSLMLSKDLPSRIIKQRSTFTVSSIKM